MMGVAPMSLLGEKLYTTRLVNDYVRITQLTLTLVLNYPIRALCWLGKQHKPLPISDTRV